MEKLGAHRIHIHGRWEIRDLYLVPHRYAELYSFFYALSANESNAAIADIFRRYPWQGGYSVVNFYDALYAAIPLADRPQIRRIEYASPGFIEIGAIILLLTQVDKVLTTAFKTWDRLDRIYDGIHRRYERRRLARIDLKKRERELERDDLHFVIDACKELSQALELKDPQTLHKLTGNQLASLKILMAFYRRLRQLVSFVHDGKIQITFESEKESDDPKRRSRKSIQ